MTVTNSATVTPQVLEAAASGAKRSAQQVTAALLDAERQTKVERRQFSPEALLGNWRLRFTAPKKPTYKAGKPQGSGFYMPGLAIASLCFSRDDNDQLTIQNQLQVGPVKLRFTGPAKFLPKKNLLAFDFVRLQVLVGSLTLINLPLRSKAAKAGDFVATSVAKLPFFSFFMAEEGYVAARGRSGGLALWVKK
ncbi:MULTISPECIES: hypothetical protein [Cyanophyceae]|uniref:Plastid lipid-associated protein/fibrillin conserved domain-containing protein n=1 Tax=Leptolyngbya subtilissima DQ-A4 TaxID=2933933 RepID=A0ABV0K780_9CYAN|nr:hypothetical protein [Nodosilinea sp. FACHB-141]MBD2112724.1 hypothetical protein [Nodosilinea sp. FACHB-141]